MDNEILESFNCPICLDICKDPVESSCCKNLFCEACSDSLNNECSFCRKRCKFEKSILAKRLIDKLPSSCEYCKLKTTRGNLLAHYKNCDNFPVDCPIETCNVNKVAKNQIMEHILHEHKSDVKKRLSDILDVFKDSPKVYSASAVYNQAQSLPCLKASPSTNSLNSENSISIERKLNSIGHMARIGETGKYYCGKTLDGPRCMCCNGSCGPTNGCNCSSCMQLDLLSRNLPKGWLVNTDGFPCRKGTTGLFYCGRLVLRGTPNCDGYCGPTNGPSCHACKKMDIMTKQNGRYSNLI